MAQITADRTGVQIVQLGAGKAASAAVSFTIAVAVNALFQHPARGFLRGRERMAELGQIFAARRGAVRPPAAVAAGHLRDGADEIARVQAAGDGGFGAERGKAELIAGDGGKENSQRLRPRFDIVADFADGFERRVCERNDRKADAAEVGGKGVRLPCARRKARR